MPFEAPPSFARSKSSKANQQGICAACMLLLSHRVISKPARMAHWNTPWKHHQLSNLTVFEARPLDFLQWKQHMKMKTCRTSWLSNTMQSWRPYLDLAARDGPRPLLRRRGTCHVARASVSNVAKHQQILARKRITPREPASTLRQGILELAESISGLWLCDCGFFQFLSWKWSRRIIIPVSSAQFLVAEQLF